MTFGKIPDYYVRKIQVYCPEKSTIIASERGYESIKKIHNYSYTGPQEKSRLWS